MRVLLATYKTAGDRKTLAAARSLGRCGHDVLVGGDSFVSPPFHSRHCLERVRHPSPMLDTDGFVEALVDQCARRGIDVVLPMDDYAVSALVKHQTRLREKVGLPVPDASAYRIAHDKVTILDRARELGIDSPKTIVPAENDSVDDIVGKVESTFGYPCVIKLRRGGGAVCQTIAFDQQSVVDALRSLPKDQPDDEVYAFRSPILQEYVPGELHDVCCLFHRGEPRAALTQRRTLMWPPGGGVGIYNETTHEPELRDMAVELLRHLGWHGPAMVEFRCVDGQDRSKANLIEVNGRLWGTLDLAIRAGVDVPVMACKMELDGDVPAVVKYPIGVRHRWPIPLGLKYSLRSDDAWGSLKTFFGPTPRGEGPVYSDLDMYDPIPHFLEMVLMVGSAFPGGEKDVYSPLSVLRRKK